MRTGELRVSWSAYSSGGRARSRRSMVTWCWLMVCMEEVRVAGGRSTGTRLHSQSRSSWWVLEGSGTNSQVRVIFIIVSVCDTMKFHWLLLSLYYERLCLSNGCCVILINDHWYSNLAKEIFFLWTMLFDIRWKICLDGITLQPAWRSQHEMVKVERSNLGRSHITNKPWWPILQCGNEGQFCLVL